MIDKPIWQEGMLLGPQHLQYQERYLHSILNTQAKNQRRYNYGFSHLVVDRQHLSSHKLYIEKAEGVLKDGTYFRIENSKNPLVLNVDEGMHNETIYLSVSASLPNSLEVSSESNDNIITRYRHSEVKVLDNTSMNQIERTVASGELNFQLITKDHIEDSFVTMPICRIKQVNPDGAIELDSLYIPPTLNGKTSSQMSYLLRETQNLLSLRAKALANRLVKSVSATAEIGDFLLLQMLNRYEARLGYLEQSSSFHPEEFFLILLELEGEFATYNSDTKRSTNEFKYKHNDVSSSLNDIIEYLRIGLTQSLKQGAQRIELQNRSHGIMVAPINDKELIDNATFILSVRSSLDPETIRKQLPPQLKVGPVERIRELVNYQLPGIQSQLLTVAPRQVPYHGDASYFSLSLRSAERSQLLDSGGIALHIAGTFDGLSIQLWAIQNN